jgi:hypothetical protein
MNTTYLICVMVFVLAYGASIGIFSTLDFFKTKQCETGDKTVDWGKITGYAFFPALGLMLIAYLVCYLFSSKGAYAGRYNLPYPSQSTSKYSFNSPTISPAPKLDQFKSSSRFSSCGMKNSQSLHPTPLVNNSSSGFGYGMGGY